MIFPKRVMVALDLSNDMEEIYFPIRRLSFLKDAEIHLVHVSLTVTYNFAMDFGGLTYPFMQNQDVIDEAVRAKIASIQEKILPYDHQNVIISKCLFGENQAKTFCDYAKEKNADLLVIAPRKKHGFFDSSFGESVLKQSEAAVFFLKAH